MLAGRPEEVVFVGPVGMPEADVGFMVPDVGCTEGLVMFEILEVENPDTEGLVVFIEGDMTPELTEFVDKIVGEVVTSSVEGLVMFPDEAETAELAAVVDTIIGFVEELVAFMGGIVEAELKMPVRADGIVVLEGGMTTELEELAENVGTIEEAVMIGEGEMITEVEEVDSGMMIVEEPGEGEVGYAEVKFELLELIYVGYDAVVLELLA